MSLLFSKKRSTSRSANGARKTMASLYPWKAPFYVNGDKRLPVILGDGGQLSAVLTLCGKDTRTYSDHGLFTAAHNHINVLAEYAAEEGFFFHYDYTSAPSEYLRAPWFNGRDPSVEVVRNEESANMVKLLAHKREERHRALVEPIIFVTISYQPTRSELKWLRKWLFGEKKRKAGSVASKALSEFNERVENFIGRMNDIVGKAHRIDADQLCSYLYYTITGLWTAVEAPDESGVPFTHILNAFREDDEFCDTFRVKAADQNVFVRAVTMYGMPNQMRPEFFEKLYFLGAGIRWSTRIILVPPNRIRKEYTDQWIRHNSATLTWRESLKQKAGGDAKEDPIQVDVASLARENVRETYGTTFGAYLVSSIIIYRTDEEDADLQAKKIVDFLVGLNKPCVVEDVGTKLAFMTTLPGTAQFQGSRDLLSDYFTVTSLPCAVPYTGPDWRGSMSSVRECVPWQYTIKQTFPGRIDIGNGQNRHWTATAPVRAGKSTFLQTVAEAMLAHMENPFIFMLDVDTDKSASRIACRALGGSVLSFERGTAATQPFRDVDISERRGTAVRWVKQCLRAHGFDDRSPKTHVRINEAFDLLAGLAHDLRTVTNFQAIVQDHAIRQSLEPFATGEYSAHVGGNKNIIGVPPYVVVDCTGLMTGDALAACVISALIDEITFTVAKHPGPVQLFLDEAMQTLPLIDQSIKGAYKRWPKQGGGITIVIHNPGELDDLGEVGKIISHNTGAWVCFKDPNAGDNAAYHKHMKLTEFHRALISEMQQGDFLFAAEQEVRVLQTDLSRLERWVLGQGGKEAADLAARIDAPDIDADEFGIRLLKEGGFYEEAQWLEDRRTRQRVHYGLAAE